MNWEIVRIKYLYAVLDQRKGNTELPLLSVSTYRGVVLRSEITEDLHRAEDLSNYKVCAPGDIVLNRMSAFQGAVGTSSRAGLVSPDYLVLRPIPAANPRFLHHLFRSHAFVGEMTCRLRGIGDASSGSVRTPRINAQDLGEISIRLPPLEEQERIARFLDAETARTDHFKSLRARQSQVLDERVVAAADQTFANLTTARWTRLKFLLRQKPRYGVLVPEFVDQGIPFVRVNDLLDLRGRVDGLRQIPVSQSTQYARTVVRKGDILLSVVGTVGRAAIAPNELIGANIARAVCSLRMRSNIIAELLVAWTSTTGFKRQAILATGTDTAQPTLGMEDLSNFALRWPEDHDEQQAAAIAIRDSIAAIQHAKRVLKRQEAVLNERHQALITAAVTGQFDVTTARGADLS